MRVRRRQDQGQKEEETKRKVEKAMASFELIKSGANMPAKTWHDIIKFMVSLYGRKSAPSKFNLMKKAKDKLVTFEKSMDQHGRH